MRIDGNDILISDALYTDDSIIGCVIENNINLDKMLGIYDEKLYALENDNFELMELYDVEYSANYDVETKEFNLDVQVYIFDRPRLEKMKTAFPEAISNIFSLADLSRVNPRHIELDIEEYNSVFDKFKEEICNQTNRYDFDEVVDSYIEDELMLYDTDY